MGATHTLHSRFFLLGNIATLIIYYTRVYSPEGTAKPAWIETAGL